VPVLDSGRLLLNEPLDGVGEAARSVKVLSATKTLLPKGVALLKWCTLGEGAGIRDSGEEGRGFAVGDLLNSSSKGRGSPMDKPDTELMPEGDKGRSADKYNGRSRGLSKLGDRLRDGGVE